MEIKKKHARELVTSSSFARSSNTFLMLILIFISTFALISFYPKRVNAAYSGKVGEISLLQAEAILNYYSGDLYWSNTESINDNFKNESNNIIHSITAEMFQQWWNTTVLNDMSGENLFDTTWTTQTSLVFLAWTDTTIRLNIYFSSNGYNTEQLSILQMRQYTGAYNRMQISAKNATPGIIVLEYYLQVINNQIVTSLYRKGNNGPTLYNAKHETINYTIEDDKVYLEQFINLSQNAKESPIYNYNSATEYYNGNHLINSTNNQPNYNGNSEYTGTITNESGEVTGNISGEIDNSNIVDVLTDEPNLSERTISSGEIEEAVGVVLQANPYENFWYQFSTGLSSALTANNSSMELDWLGYKTTITGDMFVLPLPEDIRHLITTVTNVCLIWIMLKWIKEITDEIHSGGIVHVMHRAEEDYIAYM